MIEILKILGIVIVIAFVIIVFAITLIQIIGEDDERRFHDHENEL